MKTIIKIEKEDISTNRMGMNIEVQIDGKTSLIFSPEALEELIKDYIDIKAEIESIAENVGNSLRTARDINQLEIDFEEDETRL